MSSKRAKWIRWLRVIREDLAGLLAWRDAWDTAARMLEARDEQELDRVRALLSETYTHAMAMGVRRQLKLGSRNISLIGLLEDLAAHPEAAGTDVAAVRRDLEMLRRAAKPVEAFADRAVAHADRRSSRPLPIDELHAALSALARVHDRYTEALRGGALPGDG